MVFSIQRLLKPPKFINQLRKLSNSSEIVKEAETAVGYSTSFLNLRWLLTDEIANLASHINKLIGTNHPILKTAKKILTDSSVPSWGLIVLLVAKASGVNTKIQDIEHDKISGILHTQRMVAEITEILKTGIFFHKSFQLKEQTKNVQHGNKIALLIGDYLITKSYQILAEINNSDAEEIISSALRELCEAEFFGERDDENEPLPSLVYYKDDNKTFVDKFSIEPYDYKKFLCKPKAEWKLRNTLSGASLLGKACLCSVKLGGHSTYLQEKSFSFGVNLALACQARNDLNSFNSSSELPKVSAPVLFHLESNKNCDMRKISGKLLKQQILASGSLQKTEDLLKELSDEALLSLSNFPNNEAKIYLNKILLNI